MRTNTVSQGPQEPQEPQEPQDALVTTPAPKNGYLLFRREFDRSLGTNIFDAWNALSPEVKAAYTTRSKQLQEHVPSKPPKPVQPRSGTEQSKKIVRPLVHFARPLEYMRTNV